jgi:glucose/arabinose dehydrogenase
MTRLRASATASSVGLIALVGAISAPPQPPAPREVAKIYGELCASCHGPKLEGGQAPSLLDDTWTFGGEDDSLLTSIRDGRPPTAMVSFKAALSEAEMRALVIYIREAAARARSGGLPAVTPLPDTALHSERHAFRIEPVVEHGIEVPWGLEFLPGGRMIVTERAGRVRIIDQGHVGAPLRGLPPVWVKQDGGLLDIGVHPGFAQNGWVYLAFSEPGGSAPGASTTRIVRARIRNDQLVEQETLFKAPPALYWADDTHFGARFLFDRQGHVFYSIGDRGHDADAQDLASPYGKLHRVNDDGSAPSDNPFVDRPGAVPTIWSYGHRNQQGLAWHPVTGELWSTEHGPRGGDELNIVEPGRNYGWPVITYGMNYNGTPITDKTAASGMEQPIVQWTPSIATCAIAFYTGDRFAGWKNNLFVTALAGQQLRRLVIDGHKVTTQEVLFKNLGRVRDVVDGPDGYLYVVLNTPDRIVRLVPAENASPSGR